MSRLDNILVKLNKPQPKVSVEDLEIERINEEREKKRKEWQRQLKMWEVVNPNSSSTAAAKEK